MRRQGFTLVEVMVSLGIMTIGALSLIAMQQQTTRANGRARDMTTAMQIAQTVIERLKLDGLAWNTITPGDVTDLANTDLLSQVYGATPGDFMTLPQVQSSRLGETVVLSNAFDFFGVDVPVLGASAEQLARVRYCASYRLDWVYDTHRALRADVRVWWSKEAPTRDILSDFPLCADDNAALLPGGTQYNNYHVVYLSTVIRPHAQ